MRIAILSYRDVTESMRALFEEHFEDHEVKRVRSINEIEEYDLAVVSDLPRGVATHDYNVSRIRTIREKAPETVIIVSAVFSDLKEALLEAGADEFVTLEDGPEELVKAAERHL